MPIVLNSYVCDQWVAPLSGLVDIPSAIDGEIIAQASSDGVDFGAMVAYARETGGPALRALTFHQRADMLMALATYLDANKEPLYDLAYNTGATKRDSQIDIDGGIGTLFAYAARGRTDLPDDCFLIDGDAEAPSKGGSFVGLHVMTPLAGVAVHVNAFSFPVWGTLEKLAPAFLAGMPVITKSATETAYVTEAMIRLIVEAGILPSGALQFIAGATGDLLDHLTGQDVLSFTGSIETSERLRNHPAVSKNAVRFIAERGSLNAAVLGPDAVEGTPEFELFVKEVVREMTVKAGQTCTAIRRIIVPRDRVTDVGGYISAALAKVTVGDPRNEANRMGPLASNSQREAVRAAVEDLVSEADIVFGDPEHGHGAGAFFSPVLLRARDPKRAVKVHAIEPFGPVATMLAYDSIEEAIALVAKGEGSLVASVFTYDADIASALIFGMAPYHGRLLVIDRDCAGESTGHGSPIPGLGHGGAGHAGGGEERGGLRGLKHYMQRTALQGSPARLEALTKSALKVV
jgi:oxepin-CoA hydrolase/3-oxo-5,6-dehydrosuberyl-CoA semialdehyde dehydrogenase